MDARALPWAMLEPIARRIARFPRGWGLYEFGVVLGAGSTEWLRRHRLIIQELEQLRTRDGAQTLRVLDFGGGGGQMRQILRIYGLESRYELHLVDVDRAAVESAQLGGSLATKHVIGFEPPLPFPDRAFDVAVSSDVFEHIPAEQRSAWAEELRRVTRLGQVHTMPCDDDTGHWASGATDRDLAAWYRDRFGTEERWTVEHIANGVPTVRELRSIFDGARIDGFANVKVWTESMHQQFGSPGLRGRLAFGLRYLFRLRDEDRRPPYKACLVVAPAAAPAG